MKVLFVVILASIGYAAAQCGCLKCSKNLLVAGQIQNRGCPTPIQLIYRGVPSGDCSSRPIQFTIQTPVPVPIVPQKCSGAEYGYKIKQECRPVQYCEKRYDFPVRVQTPVITETSYKCLPLVGLKAVVDRIVIPTPPCDKLPPHLRNIQRSDCCRDSLDCYGRPYRYKLDMNNNGVDKISPKTNAKKHIRNKRQVPFLDHSYKFVMNMLPKFIQEPIKNTVNIMALTHPDKKLQKIYNHPPQLTIQEKIALNHKKNIAMFKRKLFSKLIHPIKKQYVEGFDLEKPTSVFVHSLLKPEKRSSELKNIRSRYDGNSDDSSGRHWIRELTTREVIGDDYNSKHCYEDNKISLIDEAKLNRKLRILNSENYKRRYKRSWPQLPEELATSTAFNRTKRETIIIDSKELDLPFYHVKIQDNSSGERNDVDYYDSDEILLLRKKLSERTTRDVFTNSYRPKSANYYVENWDNRVPNYYNTEEFISSERDDIPYRSTKSRAYRLDNYNIDNDDSEELTPRHSKSDYYDNLFRRKKPNIYARDSEEHEQLYDRNNSPSASPNIKDIFSPLSSLLRFPIKIITGFKNVDGNTFPIVGSIPKIIVGTKRYFLDFGKNLKKNMLHFASNVVGDFEHKGSNNNDFIFNDIININERKKREINENGHVKAMKSEQRIIFVDDTLQNFREATRQKYRKKRYIVKIVNEDDIAKILRDKVSQYFDSEKEPKPDKRRYQSYRKTGNSKEIPEMVHQQKPKKYHITGNQNKKLLVEKLKPKLIIDNNGLLFMEMDGYKRPLLLKNRNKQKKDLETTLSYAHHDSSEEMNWKKIDDIVGNAHSYKSTTEHNEMPMHTVKAKTSMLLRESDRLLHTNCEEFDSIFDDLLEIEYIKKSIVQDWKRIVMEKRCNDHDSKIQLLEKFKDMQRIKDITVKNIIISLRKNKENSFVVKRLTKILIRLQKLQCFINKVVGCFEEKFKTSSKFDPEKEIRFVDFLSSLHFVVEANTRNDMVLNMKKERDAQMLENVKLLEALKTILIQEDNESITEQANLLWEMKNIEKMQQNCIEEMYSRCGSGLKIKKNLKILFDLAQRMHTCEENQKKIYDKSHEKIGEEEAFIEKKSRKKETDKKVDFEEWKKKWDEKLERQKLKIKNKLKKQLDAYKSIKY